MSPVERFRSAAEERLRRAYRRWLAPSLALSVAVHILLLIFLVAPVERIVAERPVETLVIPTVERIPPPPQEVLRPAEPIVASAEIDEEITIDVPEFAEVVPAPPAPAIGIPEPVDEEFKFYRRTVEPRCRQNCSGDAILRHLPATLRRAGVSCELVLGIRIDTSGRVTGTELLRSSENPACDRATVEWARTTVWSSAYNRDEPVVVWIAQPIEVRTD